MPPPSYRPPHTLRDTEGPDFFKTWISWLLEKCHYVASHRVQPVRMTPFWGQKAPGTLLWGGTHLSSTPSAAELGAPLRMYHRWFIQAGGGHVSSFWSRTIVNKVTINI